MPLNGRGIWDDGRGGDIKRGIAARSKLGPDLPNGPRAYNRSKSIAAIVLLASKDVVRK